MNPSRPLTVLAGVLLILGLIIAAVPQDTVRPVKLTAEQLLQKVNEKQHLVTADVIADLLVKKDPSLQLIDVRTPDEFDKFHLPGAINIPLTDLLNPEQEAWINQDVRMNVFYSNGTLHANEAWMITRQLGYLNNFVLEGGLNYWFDAIMNPQRPPSTAPNEEFAKYDFRVGAGQALGAGGAVIKASSTQLPTQKPTVPITKKKKKAAGGC